MSSPLPDQPQRDAFIAKLDDGFSVIAPAGVGKTRSIVERVVNFATSAAYREQLSSLVVVTYTNKAADEMQQRARLALLERPAGALLLSDFNQIFFGTIHSFCITLLRTQGHYLGLPGEIELLTGEDEDATWTEFFRVFILAGRVATLSEEQREACFRHYPVQDVLALARSYGEPGMPPPDPGPAPVVDIDAILNFEAEKRNHENVALGKNVAAAWQCDLAAGAAFLPVPQYEKGGGDFKALWKETFEPLRRWLGRCALVIAQDVAGAYREHRIEHGRLTYDDQIALVLALLRHPEAGPRTRSAGYRIILDEAQDTDPSQFRVLLELARPADASGIWIDDGGVAPERGRFCMVGDPQQSIYSSRADLRFYQNVSERLVDADAVEEITFHVTFRCDTQITATANAWFPSVLTGSDGQAKYVKLVPRPDAGAGCVLGWTLAGEYEDKKPNTEQLAADEARTLAGILRGQSPADLGAETWADVAILCPRRRWLGVLERVFREEGLAAQNHSRVRVEGDDPLYAWFTALMVCMAEPENAFEVVGVLREVFGLPDPALYAFRTGGGDFRIDHSAEGPGEVAETLNLLHDVREAGLEQALVDRARCAVREFGLIERVDALTLPRDQTLNEMLDALLQGAADAEAGDVLFESWVATLRGGMAQSLEPPTGDADCIQLMTCHAAKGLEWDAVILPFMTRPISSRGNDYPCWYREPETGDMQIVLDKNTMDERTAARIKRRGAQEVQRLLYVAMTRARRTLVLIDDASFFGNRTSSFAAALGIAEDDDRLDQLSCDTGGTSAAPRPEVAVEIATDLAPVSADIQAAAREAGARFPHRELPHTLADHGDDYEPEVQQVADVDTAPGQHAIRYGLWWHGLMEILDWKNPAEWEGQFEGHGRTCPDIERARTEWQLFRASNVPEILGAESAIVHTEAPLLCALGEDRCREGLIDLFAVRDDAPWLVIDWKTDRIDPGNLELLGERYGRQIEAYRESVRAITGFEGEIEAWLYSTVCGEMLKVE